MYKAIIFDFWGVMYVDATYAWFRKYVPDYERLIDGLHDLSKEHDLGRLSPTAYVEAMSTLAKIPFEQVSRGIEEEVKPIQDMVDFVKELHENNRLALISNGNAQWLGIALEKSGLTDVFNPLVVSASVGMVKPNQDIFEFTLEKLGLSSGEVIFIDDREPNVKAAEGYGIKSLLFTEMNKLSKELSVLGVE